MNAAKWQEEMDNAAGRDAFKVPPAVEFVQWIGESGWRAIDNMWQNGRQRRETWSLFLNWDNHIMQIVSEEESVDCKNFGSYMIRVNASYEYDEESDEMKWAVHDGDLYHYFTTSEMYSFFKQNKRPV